MLELQCGCLVKLLKLHLQCKMLPHLAEITRTGVPRYLTVSGHVLYGTPDCTDNFGKNICELCSTLALKSLTTVAGNPALPVDFLLNSATLQKLHSWYELLMEHSVFERREISLNTHFCGLHRIMLYSLLFSVLLLCTIQ